MPRREPELADFADLMERVGETEMVVLRAHMLLERKLWQLLAARLHVELTELPDRMRFEMAARLALSGDRNSALRNVLLELNTIRNRLAHRFDYEDLTKDLECWLRTVHVLDPEVFDPPAKEFHERLTDAFVWLAIPLMELATAAFEDQTAKCRAAIEVTAKERETGPASEQ